MDSVPEYDIKREFDAVEYEGTKALKDGKFMDAAKIFGDLILGRPNNDDKMGLYQYRLGIAYMLQAFQVDEEPEVSRKHLTEAFEQLKKAQINIGQNERFIGAQIQLSLGDIYHTNGDMDGAAKSYMESLAFLESEVKDYDEGHQVLHFKLCKCLQNSNIEMALEHCTRAIDICWSRQKQITKEFKRLMSENQPVQHLEDKFKKLNQNRSLYLLELDDMRRIFRVDSVKQRFDYAQIIMSSIGVLMEFLIFIIEQFVSEKRLHSRRTRIGLKIVVVLASVVIVGIALKETFEKYGEALKKGARWQRYYGIPLGPFLKDKNNKVIWNELAISNMLFAIAGLGGASVSLIEFIYRKGPWITGNILPLIFAIVMFAGSWQKMARVMAKDG